MCRGHPERGNRRALEHLAGVFPWLPTLEIGSGWAALVWDMAEDLEDLAGREALMQGRAVRVSGVKSEHGRLAVSWHGTPPWGPGTLRRLKGMQAVVSRAQGRASRTCERCGRPGSAALRAGWWATLCLEHHAAEERRR
jgi:hypothetical protein